MRLIAYPNSGQSYDPLAKRWSGAQAQGCLADGARGWYEAGARIIGGCCRTTPEDIRSLREFRATLMR